MDKKIIAIVILSLIIIGLIWFIFSGGFRTNAIIEQIQRQRINALRSAAIVETENSKIRKESEELRANNIESERNNIKTEEDNKKLKSENTEYRRIIDDFITGSRKVEDGLSEYGWISDDFAEFLRQATVTD